MRTLACVLVAAVLLPAAAEEDDLQARLRAKEAQVRRLRGEIQKIEFHIDVERINLWKAKHAADVLKQHEAEVKRLDEKVATAEAEKKSWENKAGWHDGGLGTLCSWVNRNFIPYEHQVHGQRHREAMEALAAARRNRAAADRAFEKRLRDDGVRVKERRPDVELAQDEEPVPRVYAYDLPTLRTMALKGTIDQADSTSILASLTLKGMAREARLKEELEVLGKLRLEPARRTAPAPAPAPAPESGLLGTFRGTPTAEWVQGYEVALRKAIVQRHGGWKLAHWRRESISMEIHATPQGRVARLGSAKLGASGTGAWPWGTGSVSFENKYTFGEGRRRSDGKYYGTALVDARWTGRSSKDRPLDLSHTAEVAWRLDPQDAEGRVLDLHLVDPTNSTSMETPFRFVRLDR